MRSRYKDCHEVNFGTRQQKGEVKGRGFQVLPDKGAESDGVAEMGWNHSHSHGVAEMESLTLTFTLTFTLTQIFAYTLTHTRTHTHTNA